jgi:SAM-dependent methyltransferase
MLSNNKTICIDCGLGDTKTVYMRNPKDNNYIMATKESLPPSDFYYIIVRCNNCNSIFLHPDYFEESFSVYNSKRYNTGYFPNNIHTGGGPNLTPHPFPYYSRLVYKHKAHSLLKLAGLLKHKSIRVVDIGCGRGNLVKGFLDNGCDAYGVDISLNAFKSRIKNIKVIHGYYEKTPFPNDYFDLIVSIQTFEHMASLDKIMNQIKKTLKSNGLLIIEVPNDIEGYRTKLFKNIWWIIPPMHIRYFTQESVKNIFSNFGFRVIDITTSGTLGGDLTAIFIYYLKKMHMGKWTNSLFIKILKKFIKIFLFPFDMLLNIYRNHNEMRIVLCKET